MNWLKQAIRSLCQWAGCCKELENRIVRIETGRRKRSRSRPSSPEAVALKSRAKELLHSGMSQSETARVLGVSRQYISKIVHKGL